MKPLEEIKKISAYLKTNKTAAVILMAFIFLYLINQDIFLNGLYKRIAAKNTAILKLKSKINMIKNTTGSLSREKNSLYGLKNQIVKLRLKLKNEEIMLPTTFMVADLIKNIAVNKPADNFAIENISFGKPVKYIGVTALPVDISVTGGFNKTIEFIKNINSMKRIFIINYVSVKASKKSFPDIKADIKGFVFSMNG
ncbi:MAG: type 4a pilus biogenesis protein PilO [Deltaproteobacteria bacterium]|jgi:Tfp pilus assembly protein PilO|nr:type 4a pilus biogenesis protein PilO [Deltaproteobacteria bacterium]